MRILLSLIIALILAAPAAAATYRCKLKEQGHSNYIPEEVIVAYDEASAGVTVFDPIIQYYVGDPISGQLRSANATRLLFGWSVPLKNSKGQFTAGMTYSLNILKASGKAQISANPQGYVNTFRGKGSCAKQK